MPKVSIIVPVYKVERYLDECAQSLLNQTCQDIEIIFVDDGSPDNCPAMCDAYQAERPDIVKVVHQANQSQNVAWNNGLAMASGKWVCFVDSDDWVEASMVETMLKYAEADDADIHAFSHYDVFKDGRIAREMPERTLTEDERANFTYLTSYIDHAAWAKLFKRSFIEEHNLRFYPGHFQHEDAVFNVRAFHYANRVCLHSEMLYHYRMVASGFIQKWDMRKLDAYYLYFKRYSEFTDEHFDNEAAAQMQHKLVVLHIYFLGEFYNHPHNGLNHKERIIALKAHFKDQYFRPAIKAYPSSLLPFPERISLILLKLGIIAGWYYMFITWTKMSRSRYKGPTERFE